MDIERIVGFYVDSVGSVPFGSFSAPVLSSSLREAANDGGSCESFSVGVPSWLEGTVGTCASRFMPMSPETFSEGLQLFCLDHACQAEDCRLSKLPGSHRYCSDHACKKCVSLGIEADLATDDPPRNACENHPMCIAPSCSEFCLRNEPYCGEHVRVAGCSATNKKGQPCKGTSISGRIPFCKDHIRFRRASTVNAYDADALDDAEEDESPTTPQSVKCIAMTRKGKPCKGFVLPGSKYCYDHSPPEAMIERDAERKPAATTTLSADKVECQADESATAEPKLQSDSEQPSAAVSHERDHDQESPSESIDDSSSTSYCSLPNDLNRDTELVAKEIDEYELEEEGENLQHLREVFEVDDGPVGNIEEEEGGVEDDVSTTSMPDLREEIETPEPVPSCPEEWTWEMSAEDRWSACHAFMQQLQELLKGAYGQTKSAINLARKDLRKAEIQAKARIYENKSVIGGTMVGCIHHLEAIRTTRPFAVVVEEASEVLEPLLFSCLSESTVKLEMIGDHRQLQPSVQSRFDFELCNKINVSMFQRLIESPQGHEVPSTVLSVQRRMRRNICDLTRTFYSDITTIEDHDSVHCQKIGQRNPSGGSIVASSATAGREVPGIGQHIYLWTHEGNQQKSHVGVSRINPLEAEMACSLVAYLVESGVPRSSIALLTPYKGQLMLIRNMLLKESKYSSLRLLSGRPGATDEIRVSTVDRFQGDEEDIVICSLVVDEKSKTGFVKLVNRMIVLLSRARLGLYILGNVGYFERDPSAMPSHWRETFKLLQLPSSSDTKDTANADSGATETQAEPRTSGELRKFYGWLLFLARPYHFELLSLTLRPTQLCAVQCTEMYAALQRMLLI